MRQRQEHRRASAILAGAMAGVLTASWPAWKVLVADPAAKPKGPAVSESDNIVVCGPRCVQFVLRYYGKDEDLTVLVEELQWPRLQSGATLGAVQEALESREIATFAMRIDPRASLSWQHPVILHLREEEPLAGHFVVWLPDSEGASPRIWDGLFGRRTMSRSQLASQMSGAILLTSATPIEDPGAAVKTSILHRLRGPISLVGLPLGALVVVLFCHYLWRTRVRARGPKEEPPTKEGLS